MIHPHRPDPVDVVHRACGAVERLQHAVADPRNRLDRQWPADLIRQTIAALRHVGVDVPGSLLDLHVIAARDALTVEACSDALGDLVDLIGTLMDAKHPAYLPVVDDNVDTCDGGCMLTLHLSVLWVHETRVLDGRFFTLAGPCHQCNRWVRAIVDDSGAVRAAMHGAREVFMSPRGQFVEPWSKAEVEAAVGLIRDDEAFDTGLQLLLEGLL